MPSVPLLFGTVFELSCGIPEKSRHKLKMSILKTKASKSRSFPMLFYFRSVSGGR